MGKSALIGVALAGSLALTACAPTFRNHGYAPTDDELQAIIVGVDTRASVEDTIGLPTTSGVTSNSAFYYLSDRRRNFAFFTPQVIDRQLVAVSFDGDGVVSNIERFTLADGRAVPISRRVTDSSVQDSPLLRQLLGNLGRFNPVAATGNGP